MDADLDRLFAKSEPVARALHDRILEASQTFGDVRVEPKGTCVHLCRGPAFAGVHPRKTGVMVTLKAAVALDSPRVRKAEQVSANRAHNDLVLTSLDEVDAEFLGWLRASFDLAAPKT